MYKALSLIVVLFVFESGAVFLQKTKVESNNIQHISTPPKQVNNVTDLCADCVDSFDLLIYFVIDGIAEAGIITACNDICDYVTRKAQSWIIGALCSVGCDAVGVNEFIKIATEVDLDPIYFCEQLQFCPINDHGDAKFLVFNIFPPHATASTTFILDLTYKSVNGTGTSQLLVNIQTLDYVKIAPFFLIEEKQSGTYAQRISIDTTPDPDCESTTYPCEEWLSGVYNVTVMICNGECGSHHPHSQVYDTIKNTFQID